MTQVISIVSGKGGVGKTMLTANLGVALSQLGKRVTIIDGNLTTPNLGLHLGMTNAPITLHDVLKGKATLLEAIYEHETGLKVVPAGISLADLRGVDAKDLAAALLDLVGRDEIVLIDAAAGLGREAVAAMEASSEVIFVTNPELPAVLDAIKASKLAEQMGISVRGCVVNRVEGRKHELTPAEIESLVDMDVLALIPEDRAVKEAIAARMPVLLYKPNSKASIAIANLARRLVGLPERVPWYARLFWFIK